MPTDITPGSGRERLRKKIFCGSLLVILAAILVLGHHSPIHSDEMDMQAYGKACMKYYASGGRDTSFRHVEIVQSGRVLPTTMVSYGAFVEICINGLQAVFNPHGHYEFDVRHLFNQLIGFLGIFYTGLIARRFGGYFMATCAVWIAVLCPFFLGNVYCNTKDIPLASFYTMSIYYLVMFTGSLPALRFRRTLLLGLAMGAAMGTRVGGLILIPYIFAALGFVFIASAEGRRMLRDNYRRIALHVMTAIALAWTVMVVSWPFALQGPFSHVSEALSIIKSYPQRIPLMFAGEETDSLSIPGNYLLKWMSISMPLAALLLYAAGAYFLVIKQKKPSPGLLLVGFASLFPVVYAMATHMALYNGWRHLLFIYPCVAVIAAFALHWFYTHLNTPLKRRLLVAAACCAFLQPLIWTVRNNPYEYIYFNEIAGSIHDNYYDYETDYWQKTALPSLEWLMKNRRPGTGADTTVIGTNARDVVAYLIEKEYPGRKIKVVQSSYRARTETNCDYGVFTNLFVFGATLRKDFPAGRTVHTEYLQGMPLGIVTENKRREDFDAFMIAIRQGVTPAAADSAYNLLRAYIPSDTHNEISLRLMVDICHATGRRGEQQQYTRMLADALSED